MYDAAQIRGLLEVGDDFLCDVIRRAPRVKAAVISSGVISLKLQRPWQQSAAGAPARRQFSQAYQPLALQATQNGEARTAPAKLSQFATFGQKIGFAQMGKDLSGHSRHWQCSYY